MLFNVFGEQLLYFAEHDSTVFICEIHAEIHPCKISLSLAGVNGEKRQIPLAWYL